jgi:transcriptional regulator with XRE-family HTH domain
MADQELRRLMKVAGISSFRSLGDRAKVSLGNISKLRRGQADLISYRDLNNLGICLGISVEDLVSKFSQIKPQPESQKIAPIDIQESGRSQFQAELQTQFQQEVLAKLESLLLQLPTAAHAITNNPNFPARNLLPLLRPLDHLLEGWGIKAIAPVGTEVNYNPRLHQLMDSADLELVKEGDMVLIRYTGYVKGKQLLYRARVTPLKII